MKVITRNILQLRHHAGAEDAGTLMLDFFSFALDKKLAGAIRRLEIRYHCRKLAAELNQELGEPLVSKTQ